MVAAKGGAKLKPSSSEQFSVKTTRGRFDFQHQSMDGLAAYLYYPNSPRLAAGRPVIDMTGIPGYFDFTLEWTPDGAPDEPASNGPSIFTALKSSWG